MKTWIALLRGVNVGGHNKLPMAQLRRDLEHLGFENTQTYIQSGNVVFRSPKRSKEELEEGIASQIESCHGFRPQVLVLSADDLRSAIENNPFVNAVADPKHLHFGFLCASTSTVDVEGIREVLGKNERYKLIDGVFYLHAPDGIARSKVAANVERFVGVSVTARNLRTVEKLDAMLPEQGS